MQTPIASGSRSGTAAVSLGPDVDFRFSMAGDGDSLQVAVFHKDKALSETELDKGDPCHEFKVSWAYLKADMKVCLRSGLGEIVATGVVQLENPITKGWETIVDLHDEVICRYCPGVGEVGGSDACHSPVIDDPKHGKSQKDGTQITRVFVDGHSRLITDVGRTVKESIFADYGNLLINIVACTGAPDRQGKGPYADPNSNWFNVFFGYYQIDVLKSDWSRPFAYQKADGARSQVSFEDLVRLGKSDWNYFSNWLYGVPTEYVVPFTHIDMSRVKTSQTNPQRIGSSLWHPARLSNFEVVSAYESDAPGAAKLVENSLLTDTWRKSFGLPNPQPDWTKSFIGTPLTTAFYLAYHEDDTSYHTTIFGGSAPMAAALDAPDEFLQTQLAAVSKVIEKYYPALGFPA